MENTEIKACPFCGGPAETRPREDYYDFRVNHEQMTELIRELLRSMEAPDVDDPEVLGERSPNGALCNDAPKIQQPKI
jgi:hypothetical protein